MVLRRRAAWTAAALVACVGLLATAGCSGDGTAPRARASSDPAAGQWARPVTAAKHRKAASRPSWPFRNPLPGMPAVVGNDVYSRTRAGMLSPKVRHDPHLVYVPDSSPSGHTVTVINPRTFKVVRTIQAGHMSQHVVPSYNLSTLVTNSSLSDEMVEINPRTGRRSRTIHVPRPYNLYYTPNGRAAIVMVEQHNVIRFSDPNTFRKLKDVRPRGCQGPNHADFSANGRFFVVTCEFSGELVKVSTRGRKVLGTLKLDPHATARHAAPGMGRSMPQDIRLSPDGKIFYVADMGTNELRMISARTFRQVGVIGMPRMPHGLYPSRNGKRLYISDRGAGKVSVLSLRTNKIVDVWKIPGGGSPDMGGVSANGKQLWLSGRYDGVVYVFDTSTGKVLAKIPVPGSPHGLAWWPQPGRYSLGHTGNMR